MNKQTSRHNFYSNKVNLLKKYIFCFVLFVCCLFENKNLWYSSETNRNKRLCERSEDVSSTLDSLINAWTHLILDTSHESFVPPVHSVWQALARISNKEVWRPLEVSGGSECGQSLADLVRGLKGNKRFEMNCQRDKIRKRHNNFGEILRGRKSFFPWCPA